MNFITTMPFETKKGFEIFDLDKVVKLDYYDERIILSFRGHALVRRRPYVVVEFDNRSKSKFYFDDDDELVMFLQRMKGAMNKEKAIDQSPSFDESELEEIGGAPLPDY